MQAWLGIITIVSLLSSLLLGLLAFVAKMPLKDAACVCAGITGVAMGIDSICGALFPSWKRDLWKRSTVEVGRLSSLGFGIAFSTGGIGFLIHWWLPGPAGWWLMGAFIAAFGVVTAGSRLDARRNRAVEAADSNKGLLDADQHDRHA